ncbi:MAG: alpha/beta fold hydrolase [Anaerolineaceae bacterium]
MARLLYGHIMARGIRINYYRTGGEKPPVVLIHGMAEYGLGWGRFPVFIEPSYDVVVIDLRGHGMSDKPETGYGIELMAEDLFWVVKTLNLIKPVVLGHSLGANVAIEFARQNPGLVRGIILEDPPWRMDEIPEPKRLTLFQDYQVWLQDLKNKPLEELIEICKQRNPTWTENENMQWAKGKQLTSPRIAQYFLQPAWDWQRFVPSIRVPGLLVTSETSLGGIVTPEVSETVAKLWKKCKIEYLPGAGHFIHREQYFKFRDVTKQFLRHVL